MEVPEVNEGLYLVFDAEGHEADVVADRWDPGQVRRLVSHGTLPGAGDRVILSSHFEAAPSASGRMWR
jgi:hypothetical protein